MDWQNGSMKPGEPYASIRSYSTSQVGYYGTYVRVLTPAASTFVSADGHDTDPINDVEEVGSESGRNTFGNYLLMPPGPSDLSYQWTVPTVATQTGGVWTYLLTLQKQPAAAPEPLSVNFSLPAGATVVSTPRGAIVSGGSITVNANFTTDLQLQLQYRLP